MLIQQDGFHHQTQQYLAMNLTLPLNKLRKAIQIKTGYKKALKQVRLRYGESMVTITR